MQKKKKNYASMENALNLQFENIIFTRTFVGLVDCSKKFCIVFVAVRLGYSVLTNLFKNRIFRSQSLISPNNYQNLKIIWNSRCYDNLFSVMKFAFCPDLVGSKMPDFCFLASFLKVSYFLNLIFSRYSSNYFTALSITNLKK